jgi:hypothetical protein
MQGIIRNWRGSLGLKGALALGLVALGDALFFERGLGGGYFGFYFLALLTALVIARPAARHDWRSWVAIMLATIYALSMCYGASLLSWTMFWAAAGMATILPATGAFDDGWRWFQRLAYHGIVACFGPLIDAVKLARVRRRRPAARISLRRSMPVLGLPLVGSAVILALFSAANPILEQLLLSIHLPEIDFSNVARMMLWLALLTMSWSLLRPRLPRRLLATFDGSGDLALPGVSVSSVTLSLIAFNMLFALQNTMDLAWLWGLMPLPEGMTLAQYAHRGAYPLIATALLAALFVLVTLRPGSTTARVPAIRSLVVLWIGQNLFLVASSILRTLDYVEAYSLTRLRISALVWMGLVGLGFVLICWRMLRGRSAGWLINVNLAAAGALLTGCCFVDLGAVAAQWNVRHAREVDGNGADIDLCYLGDLDGSALLPLIELEQRKLPGNLNTRVRIVRQRVHARLIDRSSKGSWTWSDEQRLGEAARRLGTQAQPRDDGRYDCEGKLIPVVTAAEAIGSAESATREVGPLTETTER